MIGRLLRFARTQIARLVRYGIGHPFEITLGSMAIGIVFVVASVLLGLVSFEVCWNPARKLVACDPTTVHKQLGFGTAPNWTVGMIFLMPAFIYFAVQSVNLARKAIAAMCQREMFVAADWRALGVGEVFLIFQKRLRIALIVSVFVGAIAIVFLVYDFVTTITAFYINPKLFGGLLFPNPTSSVDWTMASALCSYLHNAANSCNYSIVASALNQLFDAAAYLYLPGIGSVLAITYMVTWTLFALSFNAAEFREKEVHVVPDLKSADPRCGFELLEPAFQHAIIACLALFAMGYLLSLQNAYFQTSDTYVWNVLLPFLPTSAEDITKHLQTMASVGNERVVAVTVIGCLFFISVYIATFSLLGGAVNNGKDHLRAAIQAGDPRVTHRTAGIKKTVVDDRLAKVPNWPVRWPTLFTLLAWLFLALVSIIEVSIGLELILIGLLAALAISGLQKYILPKKEA